MADPLGFGYVLAVAPEGQVDAFGADGNFGDPKAVIKGINGIAKFPGSNTVVSQFDTVGGDSDFRCTQFKARFRADLGALAAGQGLFDKADRFLGNIQHVFKVRSRNI